MLTSGTTGQPKRAPLRYQQLEQNFKRAARGDINHGDALPMLKDDITLSFSPLVHISGMYFAISQAVEGRQVRLLERFSVDLWVTAVKELKLRTAGGPSTALKMILAASPPKESLASLVSVTSGAAGIEPEVVDQFLDKYGLPVLSTYGATEFAGAVCGWSLASFRKYWATKRGAAGRMHPGVEARTVDPESGKPLPSNTPGLLELKGPVIGDGQHWVRTSDLARIDEDHFLFVLGRADNAIIRGGFKVLPDEVVKAMEQHPAIKEASVVGLLDARLGAAPAAAYIVRDGEPAPSEVELAAFLRERLTPYQVPVRFKQVTELPRTPSMKISMPGVKALFEADA
jgi:acyl-CoA synthetase (AMP-forming)/AMP-acid ligase II